MSAPPHNLYENQLATIYVPLNPPAHLFRQSFCATHGASTPCRTYDLYVYTNVFWGHVPSAANSLRIAEHMLLALKPLFHLPTVAPSTAFGVKLTKVKPFPCKNVAADLPYAATTFAQLPHVLPIHPRASPCGGRWRAKLNSE